MTPLEIDPALPKGHPQQRLYSPTTPLFHVEPNRKRNPTSLGEGKPWLGGGNSLAPQVLVRSCSCLWSSVQFYEAVLGYLWLAHLSQGGQIAWLVSQDFQTCIQLIESRRTGCQVSPAQSATFCALHVPTVKAALQRHGVPYARQVIGSPKSHLALQRLLFSDPDGHVIQVWGAEDLSRPPEEDEALCTVTSPRKPVPRSWGGGFNDTGELLMVCEVEVSQPRKEGRGGVEMLVCS